jgi:hypothetical protein
LKWLFWNYSWACYFILNNLQSKKLQAGLSLNQIKQNIFKLFLKILSFSKIDRAISGFSWSLKNYSSSCERNDLSTISVKKTYAKNFLHVINEIDWKIIVFVYEIGYYVSKRVRRRAQEERAVKTNSSIRAGNFSVCVIMRMKELYIWCTDSSI